MIQSLPTNAISRVIGLPVHVGSLSEIATLIMRLISLKEQANKYICVANVHMLTLAHSNSLFRSILNKAFLVIPDGMPLVWTQKLKGFQFAQRVCGPDLMLELCKQASANQASIYLLGTDKLTLELLSKNLKKLFPTLIIAGTLAPKTLPQNPEFDSKLTSEINNSGADILFVGLGCPKQEFWCARHAPHLNPISIGVGAAFDFHAGTKKRPPLFIQKSGLEWLHRLISEPRRLWKRYLLNNTQFIVLSIKDFFNRRK